MKRLFIEAFIASIGVDLSWLVRRVLPLDEAATIIALRLIYSPILYSAAAWGVAATLVYRKPKPSMWKDIYADIVGSGKMFLAFASFMSILILSYNFTWLRSTSPKWGWVAG